MVKYRNDLEACRNEPSNRDKPLPGPQPPRPQPHPRPFPEPAGPPRQTRRRRHIHNRLRLPEAHACLRFNMRILVLNAGSASLKFDVIAESEKLFSGAIEGIGLGPEFVFRFTPERCSESARNAVRLQPEWCLACPGIRRKSKRGYVEPLAGL